MEAAIHHSTQISTPAGTALVPCLQTLAARRSLVYNAYDALTVAAYLRASGLRPQYRLAWTDTTVTEEWKVA